VTDDAQTTLVPEGTYRMTYLMCEKGVAFGAPRYFVHFRITEPGEHFGLPIIRYYNVPRTNRPLPRSHNLWIDFTRLFGRRPPNRLTPQMFLKGCEVLARVVTVKHRHDGGRRVELPKALWHSRIEALVRITAGWPSGIPGGNSSSDGAPNSNQNCTQNTNKKGINNGNRRRREIGPEIEELDDRDDDSHAAGRSPAATARGEPDQGGGAASRPSARRAPLPVKGPSDDEVVPQVRGERDSTWVRVETRACSNGPRYNFQKPRMGPNRVSQGPNPTGGGGPWR
jgi:hypothetical protein